MDELISAFTGLLVTDFCLVFLPFGVFLGESISDFTGLLVTDFDLVFLAFGVFLGESLFDFTGLSATGFRRAPLAFEIFFVALFSDFGGLTVTAFCRVLVLFAGGVADSALFLLGFCSRDAISCSIAVFASAFCVAFFVFDSFRAELQITNYKLF